MKSNQKNTIAGHILKSDIMVRDKRSFIVHRQNERREIHKSDSYYLIYPNGDKEQSATKRAHRHQKETVHIHNPNKHD